MDQARSICVAFAPAPDTDDTTYHEALQEHLSKLSRAFKQTPQLTKGPGLNLLNELDPSIHSLSYLAILHNLCIPGLVSPRDVVLEKLVVFLMTFDARQLRYTGTHIQDLLNLVGTGQVLPPSIAVEVMAAAILRIDPTGSMLTTSHTTLAKLAYTSNNVEPALPVIDKNIVFYPGMANTKKPDVLCDMSLPPPAFISRDTGVTGSIKPSAILEYDLLCGLMYCTRRDWARALAAFERVITYPTRDHGTSKIMTEAYKKWVLVNLLQHGKLQTQPSYVGFAANKAYVTLGKPYKEIAAAFETENSADLKTQVDQNGKEWLDSGNTGLIHEVLAAYQNWQILNLRQVYSKISIPEIRQQTRSAQTGAILPKDEDVETLIQNMIIAGTLNGVIEKNDNGITFLTFLPSSQTLSEADFAREISSTALRLKALQPIFKATSERLGTSKEYIKHLIKDQRRAADKDNDITMGMDSHMDDQYEEDLMGDMVSAAEALL